MVLDAGAHEALAVLADEQSALRRVATLVAAGSEPDAVFTAVAEEAGRLLDARSGATIRYEGAVAATVGRWSGPDDLGGFEIGTVVPLGNSEGLTAIVARTGAPARIDDYTDVRGQAAEMMRRRGYRSAVAAPVVAGGRVWGLVLVASEGVLGIDAEQRLAGFAELLALALESADARAQLNASRARILEAAFTERRRLERNLHDGAQQRLVALAIQLRMLEKPARRARARRSAGARRHGRARPGARGAARARPRPASGRARTTAGSPLRWRRWPPARRSRSASRACRPSGSTSRWRPRSTSSWPRA